MWGSGPNDIYAAAWDDPGKGLLHSKGDGVWTHEVVPERRLLAVWGSSANDVYVTGNDGILYHGHTGGPWRREHAGSRGATRGLWGSGPNDVYAVGAYREVRHSKGDGAWTASSVGDQDALLLCVWGTSAKDVWAGASGGKIFHSDGRGTWQPQTVPGASQVQAIFGFAPNDLYAAAGKLFHSTGDGRWTAVDVPGLSRASSVLGDAHGNLFVGANDGQLFRRQNGTWSQTRDKGGGDYQALFLAGDDLYIGTERFLEWTESE
jgi:hypothetical protein